MFSIIKCSTLNNNELNNIASILALSFHNDKGFEFVLKEQNNQDARQWIFYRILQSHYASNADIWIVKFQSTMIGAAICVPPTCKIGIIASLASGFGKFPFQFGLSSCYRLGQMLSFPSRMQKKETLYTYIESIGILPDYQQKGFGKHFMKYLQDQYYLLSLYTTSNLTNKFYLKCGFTIRIKEDHIEDLSLSWLSYEKK